MSEVRIPKTAMHQTAKQFNSFLKERVQSAHQYSRQKGLTHRQRIIEQRYKKNMATNHHDKSRRDINMHKLMFK